jgi:adenylate kinase
MHLIIFGAPGAGKGTQAELLKSKAAVAHISTGEILRDAVKRETPLGVKAKTIMEKGELVPDELVVGIMKDALQDPKSDNGFILDGFPRTVPQAEALVEVFKEMNIDDVVLLVLDAKDDALVDRLTNRRACKECGKIFSLAEVEGKSECPSCGAKNSFYQRDDDKEDVIRNRLEVYRKSTKPVLDYFADKADVATVDAMRPIDEVAKEVNEKLKLG